MKFAPGAQISVSGAALVKVAVGEGRRCLENPAVAQRNTDRAYPQLFAIPASLNGGNTKVIGPL